jgi:hypothetical protein
MVLKRMSDYIKKYNFPVVFNNEIRYVDLVSATDTNHVWITEDEKTQLQGIAIKVPVSTLQIASEHSELCSKGIESLKSNGYDLEADILSKITLI